MAMQPDYRPSMGAAGWGRPAASAADYDAGLRAYMLRIFNWMASGLLLTGIVAFAVANVPAVQELFYTAMRAPGGRVVMQPTLLFWVATFSPLAFMLVLSFGYQRMSKTTVQALFWLFCVCMGASLSNLAFRYTGASIGRAFFCSAAMFAGMGVLGACGHYCVARAFGYAPANILSPFQYVQLLGSVAIGWLMFGDWPDAETWVGAAIIVGAGLWIGWNQTSAGRRRAERPGGVNPRSGA